MKRSEINRYIQEAEALFAKQCFYLPPFAHWTPQDWKTKSRDEVDEILACNLGWDVTDFGSGDYKKAGLFLFTIRNAVLNNTKYPKPYAEKIMISLENQVTLMHYHAHKTEDIINRGGGRLAFRLYNSTPDGKLDDSTVYVSRDGVKTAVQPGEMFSIGNGESITLTPGLYHEFWALKGYGPVMIGEVSAVNDDHTDNFFLNPLQRFPTVEEDEEPYRLIVGDYAALPF